MARRKGEITGATNERDFPHVVELALPPDGFKSETELDAFHLERELQVRLAVASRSRAILPALSAFQTQKPPTRSAMVRRGATDLFATEADCGPNIRTARL